MWTLNIVMAVGAAAALGALWHRGVLRRDAFAAAPRSAEGLRATAWLGLAAGLFLVSSIGAAGLAGLGGPAPDRIRQAALGQAGSLLGCALFLAAAWGACGPALRLAGFRARPRDGLIGLGCLLVALPILWTVNVASTAMALVFARLSGGSPPEALAHGTLRMLSEHAGDRWWWALVAGIVIGAPIVEETLHRGLIQTALVRATASKWTAILITSALFAFVHIGTADWHALPGLFALSMAMGVVFERTGRLGAPIVMHAAFNALNLALAMVNS